MAGVAARSDDVSEGSFGGMPHDSDEGAELDGMESDASFLSLGLEEEDVRMRDDGPLFMKTTRGRDMCACLPCASSALEPCQFEARAKDAR